MIVGRGLEGLGRVGGLGRGGRESGFGGLEAGAEVGTEAGFSNTISLTSATVFPSNFLLSVALSSLLVCTELSISCGIAAGLGFKVTGGSWESLVTTLFPTEKVIVGSGVSSVSSSVSSSSRAGVVLVSSEAKDRVDSEGCRADERGSDGKSDENCVFGSFSKGISKSEQGFGAETVGKVSTWLFFLLVCSLISSLPAVSLLSCLSSLLHHQGFFIKGWVF